MGPLEMAGRSNEPFKNDLILAKFIFFLINLAKIKSCLNGLLDRPAVLSGPMAFDPIYSHKYFHICIYFIHQVIADFSKHVARAIATLCEGVRLALAVASEWNNSDHVTPA